MVDRVVGPADLKAPDDSLREQMRRLQLSLPTGPHASSLLAINQNILLGVCVHFQADYLDSSNNTLCSIYLK